MVAKIDRPLSEKLAELRFSTFLRPQAAPELRSQWFPCPAGGQHEKGFFSLGLCEIDDRSVLKTVVFIGFQHICLTFYVVLDVDIMKIII